MITESFMITKVYYRPKISFDLAKKRFRIVLKKFLIEISKKQVVSFEEYYRRMFVIFETVDDKIKFGRMVINKIHNMSEEKRHLCNQICRYVIQQTIVIERINNHPMWKLTSINLL